MSDEAEKGKGEGGDKQRGHRDPDARAGNAGLKGGLVRSRRGYKKGGEKWGKGEDNCARGEAVDMDLSP